MVLQQKLNYILKQLYYKKYNIATLCITAIALVGCAVSTVDKGRLGQQNFSARFNYIYNANELINKYVEEAVPDKNEDYNERLSVFTDLPLQDKIMDQVIKKANTVITDKGRSDYLDQAYLLLAKAYAYKRDDLTALGNLDFIISNYPNSSSYSEALTLKSICLNHLGDKEGAKISVLQLIEELDKNTKRGAGTYAIIAQIYLNDNRVKQAIPYLREAIKKTKNQEDKGRWIYLYAQLQEEMSNYIEARAIYNRIKNRAVSDQLRLCAALKAININRALNGKNSNVRDARKLLKDQNYTDSQDQIYFSLAEGAKSEQSFFQAEQYYQRALNVKGKNKTIISLSYQNIAHLNLYNLEKYGKAKLYYDSACIAESKIDKTDNSTLIKLRYLRNISRLEDSIPMKNEYDVIEAYYEIATTYLLQIPDTLQAKKTYQLLLDKYPENKYIASIHLALNRISAGKKPENTAAEKYLANSKNLSTREHQLLLHQAIMETTEELKVDHTTSSAFSSPPPLPVATSGATQPEAVNPPFSAMASKTYYVIIRIEDPTVNLSPTRYELGQFNRSQYADSQLKHHLIEFNDNQVLSIGIFHTLESATAYIEQLNSTLNNIVKSTARFNSSIITKENLGRVLSDKLLTQYMDWYAFQNKKRGR